MHKAEFEPVSLYLHSRDKRFAMTPWTGDRPISRSLYSDTGQRRRTPMARAGFDCTKPVSKRAWHHVSSDIQLPCVTPTASVVYFRTSNCRRTLNNEPMTVVMRSKAWNVFVHSNTGILGLNPTQGMHVCLLNSKGFWRWCFGKIQTNR
jgi:hypothetical protein